MIHAITREEIKMHKRSRSSQDSIDGFLWFDSKIFQLYDGNFLCQTRSLIIGCEGISMNLKIYPSTTILLRLRVSSFHIFKFISKTKWIFRGKNIFRTSKRFINSILRRTGKHWWIWTVEDEIFESSEIISVHQPTHTRDDENLRTGSFKNLYDELTYESRPAIQQRIDKYQHRVIIFNKNVDLQGWGGTESWPNKKRGKNEF